MFGSKFDRPQPGSLAPGGDELTYYHMYYRQAALFIAYLQQRDRAGFDRTMAKLMDGESFAVSFRAGAGETVAQAWHAFTRAVAEGRVRA